MDNGPVMMALNKKMTFLGVNYKTAPVRVREALAFSERESAAFIESFKRAHPSAELLVINASNRTEFYLISNNARVESEPLLCQLRQWRSEAACPHSQCFLYRKEGLEAVRQLMRVTCGLEAAILGDELLQEKVKNALRISHRAFGLGEALDQCVNRALIASERSHRETNLGKGTAGFGSVITQIIREHEELFAPEDGTTNVAIVGAGEIAREVGRSLFRSKECQLTWLNRTRSKAERLRKDFGGTVCDITDLPRVITCVDIIITATSCTEPLIDGQVMTRAMREIGTVNRQMPLLIIDTGVPRNVVPQIPASVVSNDVLRDFQQKALEERQAALPAVETIIEQELNNWVQWVNNQPAQERVQDLYQSPYSYTNLPQNQTSDPSIKVFADHESRHSLTASPLDA